MALHDLPGNRQPQPCARRVGGPSRCAPKKAPEKLRLFLGGNTWPGVADAQDGLRLFAGDERRADRHTASSGGVVQGVGQQDAQHLSQQPAVGFDREQGWVCLEVEGDAPALGDRFAIFHILAGQRVKVDRPQLKFHPALVQPGKAQQVVDDKRQAVGFAPDDGQVLVLLFGAAGQQVQIQLEAGDRRA